jgi:hypothetical protein
VFSRGLFTDVLITVTSGKQRCSFRGRTPCRANFKVAKQTSEQRSGIPAAGSDLSMATVLGLRTPQGKALRSVSAIVKQSGEGAKSNLVGQTKNIKESHFNGLANQCGGGGGIRTPGGREPSTVFKTAAIDHSATPPSPGTHSIAGYRRKGLAEAGHYRKRPDGGLLKCYSAKSHCDVVRKVANAPDAIVAVINA